MEKQPPLAIPKMQFNRKYHFVFTRFMEGQSDKGVWFGWWILDDKPNAQESSGSAEDGSPTGDGMEKVLFLRPDNTHQASLHDQLLNLNLAKGSSFSITREKFEDQPYRIIATKESSQVAKELRKATEESSPRKPPEYESVTVASLSNLMEQCLQESLNIFEHLKKEEGMEYDMGNVQSVAQTIFHKATDDRAVLRAFAPKVIDGKKESEDDLPF